MNFIRIINHGAHHAFFNMALDEAISEAVRQKLSPPTLRLYLWEGTSLSIGYFQKISDMDIEYCTKMGYPVVRRQTGGRAVLHDSELTYSFSTLTDSSLFRGSLLENYAVISKAMVSGLRLNGLDAKILLRKKRALGQKNPACFKNVSYGEVTIAGKKVIGSAQKRYRNGFLQHGSILLSFDAGELCRVLKYDNAEHFKDIGSIKSYAPDITANDVRKSLKEAFEHELNARLISDSLTKFEIHRAKELELERYSAPEWNFKR